MVWISRALAKTRHGMVFLRVKILPQLDKTNPGRTRHAIFSAAVNLVEMARRR